jgi:hypothetical protein
MGDCWQMNKYNWDRLNHLQIGRYAEYFAKMEFTLYGYDVYTAEVDDKGIDFVIRKQDQYFDVQVKSSRNYNYIFMRKDKFILRRNLLLVVGIFLQNELPQLYLVPSEVWKEPNQFFTSKDYEGKQSQPEWGLNLSKKNMPLLLPYSFDEMVLRL